MPAKCIKIWLLPDLDPGSTHNSLLFESGVPARQYLVVQGAQY